MHTSHVLRPAIKYSLSASMLLVWHQKDQVACKILLLQSAKRLNWKPN